ncbi:hypothetical protein FRC06_003365 [Ceratobasidium sp. 370]|nr:hypothetical protein FRC06_003365 [Ceratobasidium sp. 370]
MPLRLRSPSASSDDVPSLTFNWSNVEHPLTPESIYDAPSPPAALLPADDMHVYGATPLLQPLSGVIKCPECNKPLLASALAAHAANCAEIRAGGDKKAKSETKAEKKAKKDRERELKKAEKEAVASKKRKHPGAPNQGGTGTGTSGAGVTGGGGGMGSQARGGSTDYESGLDTDVELDVLVRSVRASRPTPLADRDNVGNWFIARNEWLRSTRDLLGDALGGGATGFSARRIG